MHPIDGDKLLGDGVRNPEVIGRSTGDAADYLALVNASQKIMDTFPEESPPVCPHGDLKGGVTEDRSRPLDSMNFGEQGRIDQAGALEERLVGPLRIGGLE